ncbi:MAG: hypothetical protein JWN15_4296 [Firmicutes bacterium]|nr:hypothetical protein [Bacillota bacterium]
MPDNLPKTVGELDTPTLVIDLAIMEQNLQHASAFARLRGVALRPHTKTHKSVALAQRQMELGACGVTVAKPGEAEVMAAGGIRDLFVAHHVVGTGKLERLRALQRQGVRIAVSCDHVDQARMISAVFGGEPAPLEVMIEVDTGQHRSGLEPGTAVAELARAIREIPGLRVRGIFTHEGHSYYASSIAELREGCIAAQQALVDTAGLLQRQLGLSCEVSIGSTPTLLAESAVLPGITEMRPGTYIFNDLSMAGIVGRGRCAATILATVTSIVGGNRVILDTGSKSLSQDKRADGICKTAEGYGYLVGKDEYITRLSEEHGVVVTAHPEQYSVGEKVRILPNHVCVTVNLAQQVVGVRGNEVVAVLTADARGRLQ